ncbi:putative peptidoglycan binding protein [Candidatus Nitrotoga sp. HW29]|uniref:FecR domain-containing protein n=1 Tax=Candidatus Nitrotoga sp. HW29 TaxID=2886963 RepID=UPI001EF209D2|nr:FecR domain-containing protein [Candidatus Nitrotoga sp. HW29]CAH1905933.1 putative peptidoglycan binding protein [Candidatus Nitrotoga sp. HW29]
MLHSLYPLRYVTVLLLGLQFVNPAAAAEPEWLYVVNPGDTLISVATGYLANPNDWRQLQKLNNVIDPRRLKPGTKLRLPVALLKRKAVVAEAIHVQGKVTRTPKNGRPQNFIAGTRLETGDIIETGPDASVSIHFVDGSRLLLTQNTQVSLAEMMLFGKTGMAQTIIELNRGSLDTHVTEQQKPSARYEIKSRALNLVVRGTHFRAHVGDIDHVSRSEVLDGAMQASGTRGEAVIILAGFGTLAAPGESPRAPQALSLAPDLSSVPSLLQRVPLRFEWPATAGTERYHAQVFADRSFERLLLDGIFQGNTASWPDLPDGHYILRVRSIDNNGLEGANADREFMLKVGPESPVINTPRDGQKIYGSQTTLRWNASNAAHSYHVQLATKPDFSELIVDLPEEVNSEYTVSLAPGQYYWRIASIAAEHNKGPFSDVQSFTQHKAPPEPPVINTPRDGQKIYGSQATLRWNASNTAHSYHVQLATKPDFSELLADLPEEVNSEYTVPLTPGQYYWRIASIAAEHNKGPFSDVQSFTQRKTPESPQLEPPQINDKRLFSRWHSSAAGEKFQIQVARDPNFTQPIIDNVVNISQSQIDSLEPGIYYLRVKTIDADGFAGPFGSAQRIEVPTKTNEPVQQIKVPTKTNYWWLLFLLVPFVF